METIHERSGTDRTKEAPLRFLLHPSTRKEGVLHGGFLRFTWGTKFSRNGWVKEFLVRGFGGTHLRKKVLLCGKDFLRQCFPASEEFQDEDETSAAQVLSPKVLTSDKFNPS